MSKPPCNLGERIIALARLATAMHLDGVLARGQGQLKEASAGGAGWDGVGGAGPETPRPRPGDRLGIFRNPS